MTKRLLPILTALVAVLLASTSVMAQLKLTRDFSSTSKAAGASTLVGGAVGNLPAPVPVPAPVASNIQREVDFIVAIVNSEPVTRNEVNSKLERFKVQWAAQGVRPPAQEEAFKQVLERVIEERALLQLAKDMGVRIAEDQLQEALLTVARQNQLPHLAALQEKYESQGGNWQSYRAEIRTELTLLQLREREVDARVRVSEGEIDTAARAQSTSGPVQQDINMAQILIALPENPSAAALAAANQKAQSVVQRARAGEDFGALAQQFSDSADKAAGGVIGLRPVERYPSLFADAVQALKVGEIASTVQSGAGLHVLKLLEKKISSASTVTQTRARHILLPVSKELTEAQAINRLIAIKNKIDFKQTTFADAARDHSTDGSAAQGGDLGWAGPGMFVPEFERTMNKLAIGGVSDPVVSRFGVHLIEVTDRKDVVMSEREQRAAIRDQLRAQKAGEAYTLWVAETRSRAYVEYRNQ